MTITELKAKAYDVVAQIQFLQAELAKINEEISKIINESKDKE